MTAHKLPRILISTKALFMDDDVLVLNVKEHTLSRGPVLVRTSKYLPSGGSLRFKLLRALVICAPRPLKTEELIEKIWFDDCDGGPLEAHRVVYTVIHRIHQSCILECLGLEIRNEGRGYFLAATDAKQFVCAVAA